MKHLRDELSKARREKRDAKELAQTYALIIDELAENLAAVTAERDALASSPQLPQATRTPTSRTLQRVNHSANNTITALLCAAVAIRPFSGRNSRSCI